MSLSAAASAHLAVFALQLHCGSVVVAAATVAGSAFDLLLLLRRLPSLEQQPRAPLALQPAAVAERCMRQGGGLGGLFGRGSVFLL